MTTEVTIREGERTEKRWHGWTLTEDKLYLFLAPRRERAVSISAVKRYRMKEIERVMSKLWMDDVACAGLRKALTDKEIDAWPKALKAIKRSR